MPEHTICQGDSLISIAVKHRMGPDTIWQAPENENLRTLREEPELLIPGDRLFIPEMTTRVETAATGQRHSFVRKGVPAVFRVVLETPEGPRAQEPYVLRIDGKTFSGETTAAGLIEITIPPDARKGELLLCDGEEKYEIQLGHLDPADKATGFQARLQQLGVYYGKIDGEAGPKTLAALHRFQSENGLEKTDEIDTATLDMLRDQYGS